MTYRKTKNQKVTQAPTGYKKCYETHPPLILGDHKIYGGSCVMPIIKDADIYIGFDNMMKFDNRIYPWAPGEAVFFPIADMHPPKDVEEFKKMIYWTLDQLEAGKKIHAGCIGGHGRTGLFFSALTKTMLGRENATTFVRENYCKKAVESKSQIDWLHKHFGIAKVTPTKSFSKPTKSGVLWSSGDDLAPKSNKEIRVKAMHDTNICIWG